MSSAANQPRPVEAVRWPVFSMLLFGSFGTDAPPASQRADLRSRIAIVVYLLVAVVLATVPGVRGGLPGSIDIALLGLLFAFLAWQRWSYSNGLDELGRQLYLEAFAITYLLGLSLFAFFGVLHSLWGWSVNPSVFMVLEPARGVILVWRSRQFGA